jgi:hypothetical protein
VQAWAEDDPIRDDGSEPGIDTGEITGRCDARHERLASEGRRLEHSLARILRERALRVRFERHREVDMRVEESGQHGGAMDVHLRGIWLSGRGLRSRTHPRDPAVFNPDLGVRERLRAGPVDQPGAGDS